MIVCPFNHWMISNNEFNLMPASIDFIVIIVDAYKFNLMSGDTSLE